MKGLVKHNLTALSVSGFLPVAAFVETEFVGLEFAVDLRALILKDPDIRRAFLMLHLTVH